MGKGIIIIIILLISLALIYKTKYRKNTYEKQLSYNLNLSFNKLKMKQLNIIPLDFKNNDFIPSKFTCDGENLFPRIEVKNIPKNAKTLTILVEDPDAPMSRPFIHLLVVNIPVSGNNITLDKNTLNLGTLGTNDFGQTSWGGPCPPAGDGIHHYHFKIFALDTSLPLKKGFNLDNLKYILENNQNPIIGYQEIIGLYKR